MIIVPLRPDLESNHNKQQCSFVDNIGGELVPPGRVPDDSAVPAERGMVGLGSMFSLLGRRGGPLLLSGAGLAGLASSLQDTQPQGGAQLSPALQRMILFPGQSHPQLSSLIAHRLGVPVGNMIPETFRQQ